LRSLLNDGLIEPWQVAESKLAPVPCPTRVQAVPSLHDHHKLHVVELGSLKGLETLQGVIAAPSLRNPSS